MQQLYILKIILCVYNFVGVLSYVQLFGSGEDCLSAWSLASYSQMSDKWRTHEIAHRRNAFSYRFAPNASPDTNTSSETQPSGSWWSSSWSAAGSPFDIGFQKLVFYCILFIYIVYILVSFLLIFQQLEKRVHDTSRQKYKRFRIQRTGGIFGNGSEAPISVFCSRMVSKKRKE